MNILKKINLTIAAVLAFGVFMLPVSASAQLFDGAKKEACSGASLTASGGCKQGTNENRVNKIITAGFNILSIVVGIAAVVMIIIGGLRFITAGGDANSISAAKNSILYALVGLILVALSQAIVRFVLTRFN